MKSDVDLGEKSEPRFAVGLRHFAGTQRKGWSVSGQRVASNSKDDTCFRHIAEPDIPGFAGICLVDQEWKPAGSSQSEDISCASSDNDRTCNHIALRRARAVLTVD